MSVCRPHPPSSIVGYSNSKAVRGFQAAGASFIKIGGGDVDIQDLKPTAPAGEAAGGWVFYIADMNIGGATDTQYVYLTKDDDGVTKDGWYDADYGETYITGKTYKEGEGFYFSAEFDDNTSGLTTSGQVELEEFSIDCGRGFCARCNPRPVEIDIQDIKPVAPEGEAAGGWVFYIADMNIGGATDTQYVYLTKDDDGVAKDGWYDADYGETYITGKKFAPGKGFYFSAEFDKAATFFPTVTLEQ